MNLQLFLARAKGWAANPPSARRVALVLGVIAACLAIAGWEWAFGWPDWLTPERLRPNP